jgi:hypothetical protein
MRRLRFKTDSESPARSAGLQRKQLQESGFKCRCGLTHPYSKYVLAHWQEPLEITCTKCGRIWSVRAGLAKLKRQIKKKPAPALTMPDDPRKPMWRGYWRFNQVGRGYCFKPITDYGSSSDAIGDACYDFAQKQEPYSKSRCDEFYATLLRKKEFPGLSLIETDGLIVGGGDLIGVGVKAVRNETRWTFALRTPDGNESHVELTREAYLALIEGWELQPKESKR